MNSGSEGFPWDRLGIAPTRETGDIRRAYAQVLKTIDAAADPAAFHTLRQAYEAALAQAAGGAPAAPSPEPARPATPARPTAPPSAALQAIVGEFAALGRKERVDPAMAVVDRRGAAIGDVVGGGAELEAALFSAAMDDPEMPPALLAALARRFHWGEVGSALEERRPDLYNRYLHRMGLAQAWLRHVKAMAERPDIAGETARKLLLPYTGEAALGDRHRPLRLRRARRSHA